jgi:hypothetical protein
LIKKVKKMINLKEIEVFIKNNSDLLGKTMVFHGFLLFAENVTIAK